MNRIRAVLLYWFGWKSMFSLDAQHKQKTLKCILGQILKSSTGKQFPMDVMILANSSK